jgi:hypothetical protein
MKFKLLKYLLFIVFTVYSCENGVDTLTLGKEIVDPSSRLMILDTFTVDMSTVIMDSILTSAKNILLAGVYNDANLGKISSKSYFQVGLPRSYAIGEHDIFDSLTLYLSYTNYSLGDTNLYHDFSVHKISGDYNPDNLTYFYNTHSIAYESAALGSIHLLPRPVSGHKFEISLDESLGTELFNFLKGNKPNELSDEDLENLLQGLALVPEEAACRAMLGFRVVDTSLYLKIYIHNTGLEEKSYNIHLPVSNAEKQFNQISCDWSNMPVFDNHIQKNEISSSLTGGVTYIRAGLGLCTKVTFPSLPSILEYENCKLVKALLYFEPAKGTYDNLPDLSKLRIFETGKHNTLDAILLDAAYNELVPTLKIDKLYNEETYYAFDITNYINKGFSSHYLDPAQALTVSFSSTQIALSIDQIILESVGKNLNKPQLELLLLFYDQ